MMTGESKNNSINTQQVKLKQKQHIPVLHKRRLPILLRLTRRAVVFFSLLLMALLLFFYMGNIQNFLEKDLTLILLCVTCISIALCLFALAGIVESIVYTFIYRHIFFLSYTALFVIVFAIAFITAVVTKAVNLITTGI